MDTNPMTLKSDIEGWINYFKTNPPGFGGVDVLVLGRNLRHEFVASLLQACAGLADRDRVIFTKVCLLLPVGFHYLSGTDLERLVLEGEYCVENVSGPRGQDGFTQPTTDETREINFRRFASNDFEELRRQLDKLDEFSAVVLPRADLFASGVALSPLFTTPSRPLSPGLRLWSGEDVWVGSLVSVLTRLEPLLLQKNLFLIVPLSYERPAKPENQTKLEALENATIVYSASANPEIRIIEMKIEEWLELAVSQQVDSAIEEIDLEVKEPINNCLVKAQVLVAAKHPLRAIEVIEPFLDTFGSSDDPSFLVSAAAILTSAGMSERARVFISKALDENLSSEMMLETARSPCEKLGDFELRDRLIQRLQQLFPQSESALHNAFYEAVVSQNFELFDRQLEKSDSTNEFTRFLRSIREIFLDGDLYTEDQLILRAESEVPDYIGATLYYYGLNAFSRHDIDLAATMLISSRINPGLESHAISELIKVIEAMFLDPTPHETARGDITLGSIRRILTFISKNPTNELRNSLHRICSVSTSGFIGVAYLVELISRLQTPAITRKAVTEVASGISPEETLRIIEQYLSLISSPGIFGISKLPTIPAAHDPEDVRLGVTRFVEHAAIFGLPEGESTNWFLDLLHIAVKLNQELGTSEEYDVISTGATAFIGIGEYQEARNLVEHGLMLSELTNEDSAKRKAWRAFADIYVRCHNRVEALIAIACMFLTENVALTPDDHFAEQTLLARILRDFELYQASDKALRSARTVIEEITNSSRAEFIIQFLELSNSFQQFSGIQLGRKEKLETLNELASRGLALYSASKAETDEVVPILALLDSIRRLLSHLGEEPSADIVSVTKLLYAGETPDSTRYRHILLGPDIRNMDTFERLAANLGKNRYLADRATDIFPLVQFSRQLLAEQRLDEHVSILFLIELLSSNSLNTRFTFDFARNREAAAIDEAGRFVMSAAFSHENFDLTEEERKRLIERSDETNLSQRYPEYARMLSREDLSDFVDSLVSEGVVLSALALDASNELINLYWDDKIILGKRESGSVFNNAAYRKWQLDYPFEYHKISTSDAWAFNKISRSMEGIGFSRLDDSKPAIIVTHTLLQNIPPNLYLVDGNLLGQVVPTCLVPSLNWLQKCFQENVTWVKKRVAWIPKIDTKEDVLTLLYDLLNSDLVQNDFAVISGDLELGSFEGADIAIVGAHGRVWEDNSFFRSVSDEGTTRISSPQLSKQLRRCNLVILFVCSGGRLDDSPFDARPVGMPLEILDNGCRTVIASPYPLDVRIPVSWLPAFLDNFLSGKNVTESCFLANQEVSKEFGHNPVCGLAMNVFGDPLLKIPSAN